ncbi:unnamed protein product [Notodromas monacha]|uniref:C2H2-type domain-containing protein n=1 Tax=Notodromas monacha TaxID=399045 RepID=A0A7R9BMH8_9CRUS|nr:unnamed protein product [Notodromas monacha]CAG0916874.1 unnamed protein product [Notodromas monacha]
MTSRPGTIKNRWAAICRVAENRSVNGTDVGLMHLFSHGGSIEAPSRLYSQPDATPRVVFLPVDVGEMPLLVRPDLIGNCVRQLFCMRGAGGEPGPLGLLPPSLGATPQSSLPSSASTIAAIPVGADGQSIQCSLCLKVIQRVSFARHKRMHKMAEGSIASVHECDVCNRKFYRKDNYVKHLDSSAHFKALRQKRSLMELTQQQQLHQQLCAGLPVFPRSSPSPPAFATPYQPPSLGVVKPGSDDGRAESADDADEDTKGNRSAPASP